ncbi:tRNA pseudouridine(55) synthase TruB [Streptococcus fryi]
MISGIINLKKEAGMTSHDAVFKLRKLLNEKKIGHGGTLDPDVVGVLPIAVGKATRVIEYMTDSGKVYEGQITLGYSTTTEDASGDRISEKVVPKDYFTTTDIDLAMTSFEGEIKQIPPMYSAVKVNGRKLYEYARAGETVERPERTVTIHSFERISPLKYENDCLIFDFRVSCSKGTYVRTLAVDLGESLGFPSHMSFLERTSSAGLELKNALTLDNITVKRDSEDWSFLLPIEYGLMDLPKISVNTKEAEELLYGRFITLNREEPLLAAFLNDKVIAVIEKRGDFYKPRKVLR